jgi:rhodanese-related sulfurtransferase
VTTDRDGFGLVVTSGLLVLRVGRSELSGAELPGRGDLLRPWLSLGQAESRPFEAEWQVIVPAEVAVLDAGFARRVSRFPEIATQLLDRAMLRSRHLAMELSIVQERRVDNRLDLLLWQLADRWGQMTADGARVVAPVDACLLADVVAARRPSVTTALRKLAEDGSARRPVLSHRIRWVPRRVDPERTTIEALLAAARAEIRRFTPAETVDAVAAGAVLVDIRQVDQRERDGLAPGARLVDRNVLEWRLDPDCPHRDPSLARRDRQVILLCNEGYQSSLAAAELQRFGLSCGDVIGGFQAWKQENPLGAASPR